MPHRVLAATPDGSFTYNATITEKHGTKSEVARTQHRRIREEGEIIMSNPPKTYKITHSTGSGVWFLGLEDPQAAPPLIVAIKPKWYRNTIKLEMGGEVYEFVRPSLHKRDYLVGKASKEDQSLQKGGKKKDYELSGPQVGELLTDGTFKRTYTIRFEEDIPVELPIFCYWLVSILNKRSNNASSGGGGGGGASGGC